MAEIVIIQPTLARLYGHPPFPAEKLSVPVATLPNIYGYRVAGERAVTPKEPRFLEVPFGDDIAGHRALLAKGYQPVHVITPDHSERGKTGVHPLRVLFEKK